MKPFKFCKAILPIAMVAAALMRCTKEEPSSGPDVPPSTQSNPLQQVFAQNLAQATQHFTINTDNGPGYVNGANGLFAAFGQHAFRKADGSNASGPIDIALVEAFDVGKMLWLNQQTVGLDGGQRKLLVSGGQFRLTASQNGAPLHLVPGGNSYIQVPTTSPLAPQMAVFSGTAQADGAMLWNPWQGNPIVPNDTASSDSVPPNGGYFWYNFPNDSLGWINCDYFYGGSSPLTDVTITCPSAFDHTNTMVWVVFPDLNSMADISGGTGNTFVTGGGYELPIGLNITVVALADVDDQYSSSFTDAVVSDGMNLAIDMEPTTLEQFQEEAGGL